MRTVTPRMDGQEGPAVQHRQLYSVFGDKQKGKEIKKNVCVYTGMHAHTHTHTHM